jgi:hypothetical protein
MDVDVDRGHGRTEQRTIRVTDCDDTLFPGTRQVFGSATTPAVSTVCGPNDSGPASQPEAVPDLCQRP